VTAPAQPGRGLFVSDVDGTLVNPDKQLTPASLAAAADLRAAGVPFTLISARPPRGMAALVRAMGVSLPFAAFNGGALVGADMKLIEAHRLAPDVARRTLALLERRGIEVFVFADDAWLLRDAHGVKTDLERRTVGFEPTVVDGFEALLDRIDKIVGVSDDPGQLDVAETDLRQALGTSANIERSQAYYLDITHPLANKGEAVRALAARIGADLAQTVVLGDMTNDVAMFRVAGFAIAMGQAPLAVKAQAEAVTLANSEDGFAHAVRTLVLPRLARAGAEAARPAPTVLVVMGVSGSGKSTLGEQLAERLGWTFKEGDDLHPPANIAKMSSGQPLNDADRAPWLAAVGRWIDAWAAQGRSGVITCSALKRAYRETLAAGRPQVRFVFLDAPQALIAERLEHRKGHFWPAQLLASQFADLEAPSADEHVIRVDGRTPTAEQVAAAVAQLQAAQPAGAA